MYRNKRADQLTRATRAPFLSDKRSQNVYLRWGRAVSSGAQAVGLNGLSPPLDSGPRIFEKISFVGGQESAARVCECTSGCKGLEMSDTGGVGLNGIRVERGESFANLLVPSIERERERRFNVKAQKRVMQPHSDKPRAVKLNSVRTRTTPLSVVVANVVHHKPQV